MYLDIYQVDNSNIDELNFLYNQIYGKLYNNILSISQHTHYVFVLTQKEKSKQFKDLIGLAEIFSNMKTVEIWNLVTIKNSKDYAFILLENLINFFKTTHKFFWVSPIHLDFVNNYKKLQFEEIEPLKQSPLTLQDVSERRQFILNSSKYTLNTFYNTIQTIDIDGIHYNILQTIDDGSCFFHGILYAVHPNYHKLDTLQQKKAVAQFRKSLSQQITTDLFKILGGGQLAVLGAEIYAANNNINISNGIPNEVFQIVQNNYITKIADTRKWAGEENIDLLYNIFELGILILTPDSNNNPSIYHLPYPENYYSTVKNFVVLWYEQSHYDVVIESPTKRSFKYTDPIVNYFRNN